MNPLVKSPEIPLDKIPNWNGDPPRGSQYSDAVPDVFPPDVFPVGWDNPWPRRWGGWTDDSSGIWFLYFDYGDPVEGEDYLWAEAELVFGQFGNDPEGWYVHFTMDDERADAGWGFCDAHADFTDPEATRGNPGRFDWKVDFNEPQAEVFLFVGEDEPDLSASAIHATLCWYDAQNDEWIEETGWGTHSYKTTAMFDPVADVGYRAYNPGTDCYWNINFTALDWIPWPDPTTNPFCGWCTDPSVMYNGGYPSTGNPYIVDVWSCYDPDLPYYAMSDHWDLISWILNARLDADSGFYNYDYKYTQRAIWYFKYGNAGGMANNEGGAGVGIAIGNAAGTTRDTTPGANAVWALIDAAIANGENYYPGPGEYFAAILFPANSDGNSTAFQMNITAVDP